MKALIIAAGRGSRLGDITNDKPKALTPILGVTLIERTILTVKQADINEYLITVGYLGDKIKDILGDGQRLGVRIKYIENDEWQKSNGISVFKAKELLSDRFLLLMSDHIFDHRILQALLDYDTKKSVVLAVDRRESPSGDDTKVLEKDGSIVDIGKRIKESNCIDTGIFLCSPKVFAYLENAIKDDGVELSEGIATAARDQDADVFDITRIDPYIPSMRKEIKPFWIDIDTHEDIVRAEKILIENSCKGRNDFLATYVNKPVENLVVKMIAGTRVSPNQITFFTNVIAYAATIAFLGGSLLFATLITFIVSILDGVDGKLSRIKIASSSLGKMEHAFDFLFEHSWYIALAIFLSNDYGVVPVLLITFNISFDAFSLYVQQLFESAKKGIQLVDYGGIERTFRKFDGRKNIYIILILVGILINAPFGSVVAITFWSFVSAGFYCVRAMKHLHSEAATDHHAEGMIS
jgi:CDP-L-myo-inositol myo-inositolphosphotransferase